MRIESKLIGIVSNCELCNPSKNWLGKYSPLSKINSGKLWLSQHLNSRGLTEDGKTVISHALRLS